MSNIHELLELLGETSSDSPFEKAASESDESVDKLAEDEYYRGAYMAHGFVDTLTKLAEGVTPVAPAENSATTMPMSEYQAGQETNKVEDAVAGLKELAKQKGCSLLTLDTMNWEAEKFYLKRGFEKDFERANYELDSKMVFFKKVLKT